MHNKKANFLFNLSSVINVLETIEVMNKQVNTMIRWVSYFPSIYKSLNTLQLLKLKGTQIS